MDCNTALVPHPRDAFVFAARVESAMQIFWAISMNLKTAVIDPATKYCQGAPIHFRVFCGNGWESDLTVFLQNQ
jgi:hypothetical protein